MWRGLTLFFLLIVSAPPLSAQEMTRSDIADLNKAAYQTYTTDFNHADSLFRHAATTAATNNWQPEEANARKNLGIVTFLKGDYDEALTQYQTALSQFEALKNEAGQAGVLIEMGNFFKKRNEHERAVEMLGRGGELALAAGDQRLYSNSLDIRGRILQDGGDWDSAENAYHEVLNIRRSIRDTIGLSYVFDNLAAVQTLRGNFERSLAYLDSTIAIRRILGDRQGIAIAVNNQGEALLAARDTAGAIPYFEESLTVSSAIGFTDLQQWTMNLLSQAYAATGRVGEALGLQRRVQTLKDSLYNATTTTRVAEMQEKYESEKRAAELALSEAQLTSRTALLIAAVLGIGLLITLLFYRSRLQRQRQEQLRREAEDRLRDDRLRISRDLHDHLGAELSIIASNLGRLDHQLDGAPLQPITAQVRYAMEQMRETIWAVRLEDATWSDLAARLRTFADKLPHDNIQVDIDQALTAQPLDPNRVLNLYRFAQEAMANAVKHAAAGQITVRAQPHQLVIKDDGKGFDPAVATGGYGMSSLKERAAELGGTLLIQSQKGGGTRLILAFAGKQSRPR